MGVYVSNFLGKSISIIDYESLEEIERIYLGENIHPHHFCIDSSQKNIYVPSSYDGVLYVLNTDSKKIQDNISIGGNLSQASIYNEETIFIANEDSNSIYMIDLELNPIGIISVYDMPHGMILDKDYLYVPCENKIVIIDCKNKNVFDEKSFDFKPWHIRCDRKNLYVVTKCKKVVVIDKITLKEINTIDCFKLPIEIGINNKAKELYVTDFCDKSIFILKKDTLEILKKIYINGSPLGLDLNEEKELLFISDINNNNVKVIDLKNYKIIKEIKVDKEPTTLVCR